MDCWIIWLRGTATCLWAFSMRDNIVQVIAGAEQVPVQWLRRLIPLASPGRCRWARKCHHQSVSALILLKQSKTSRLWIFSTGYDRASAEYPAVNSAVLAAETTGTANPSLPTRVVLFPAGCRVSSLTRRKVYTNYRIFELRISLIEFSIQYSRRSMVDAVGADRA
jgi:hypothetical protein